MSRWKALHDREGARMFYSAINLKTPRGPSPEEAYYSVQRSRQNKASNRYADIFAYDRTAVDVDGQGQYINANVVKDGFGTWWVAAQVGVPSSPSR